MRIDVKKFLFIGLEEDRKEFFKRAQEIGVINFIEKAERSKELPQPIQDCSNAIKVLRSLPTMEQEESEDPSFADVLIYKILHHQNIKDKLIEEERLNGLEIDRTGIFGNFSKSDIEYIEQEGKRKLQFYFGKHSTAKHSLPEEVVYVGSDHNLDYYFAINPIPTQYDNLVEMRVERPVGELRKREIEIEKELHLTEQHLKTFAKYNTFLHHALIDKLNTYHLHAAQEDVLRPIAPSLFNVMGWVPENKIQEVSLIADEMQIHMTQVAIKSTDTVPTYLENHGINKIGEDVISIYDNPSRKDKDPSLWVLFSFAFFFAFIIADAGYGLLFLLGALYVRYKNQGLQGIKKRFLNLAILLFSFTLIWGVLTTQFFGIEIGPENPLHKVSILHWLAEKKAEYHIQHHDEVYTYWIDQFPQLNDVENPETFLEQGISIKNGKESHVIYKKFVDNILLELAIMIGVIHIMISFLRYIRKNPAGIGWILFLIGCYLYFPEYLGATSIIHFVFGVSKRLATPEGVILIFGGISIAWILSIIRHGWKGAFEGLHVIQIFSDVMSYLRLYALALAGMIMAETINEGAASLNIVFATVLIIAGHAINMVLSIQGGIIHGLRLNFIEWYHYSFEGGGKLFKPLRKLKIE